MAVGPTSMINPYRHNIIYLTGSDEPANVVIRKLLDDSITATIGTIDLTTITTNSSPCQAILARLPKGSYGAGTVIA